jgi:hypothetical protein
MERPSLASWIIPVLTSSAAVVTVWAKHNMELTLPWAIGCYTILGAMAVGAYAIQSRTWKKCEASRRQEEAWKREAFLNESIPCEGIKCHGLGYTYPKRLLWRMPDSVRVCTGKAVCDECFSILMGRLPSAATDKRAF